VSVVVRICALLRIDLAVEHPGVLPAGRFDTRVDGL
jgi:hypothetical protein